MDQVLVHIICLYIMQLFCIVGYTIIAGIINDPAIMLKKKTFVLWCIPVVYPIYWIIKGLINGLKGLR